MSFDVDHTFKDKYGRSIDFEVGNDIVAHVDGGEIGSVHFDEEDDYPIIFSMHVIPQYHRAGIATEMIRLAAEVHGRTFGRPSFLAQGGSNKSSTEYFTQDGAALISHCIKLGIIDGIPESPEGLDDCGFDA